MDSGLRRNDENGPPPLFWYNRQRKDDANPKGCISMGVMQAPPHPNQSLVQTGSMAAPVVPILEICGRRVILSSDLAEIYGGETKAINQAVKRNSARFPADFAFRLSSPEALELRRSRSQSVTLKRGQNIKYPPMAFTEHGALMAATVLNSPRAIHMSIFVIRGLNRCRARMNFCRCRNHRCTNSES